VLYLKALAGTATVEDEEKGIAHMVISAYGNVDEDGDEMVEGAFTKSIQLFKSGGFRPAGLAYHDQKRPCAKTLDTWEDGQFVHVIGQYNLDITDGREVFSNVKGGYVTTYSHGFVRPKIDRSQGRRRILDLQWKEWSPVAIPANLLTHTIAVKGLLRDGMTFADQSEMVLDAVEDLLNRAEEIDDLRQKEGRSISKERHVILKSLEARLTELVRATTPGPTEEEVRAEVLHQLRRQQAYRALLGAG